MVSAMAAASSRVRIDRELLEVAPGDEHPVPGTGDHQHARRRRLDLVERVRELLHGGPGDGVAGLGPVDGEHRDRARRGRAAAHRTVQICHARHISGRPALATVEMTARCVNIRYLDGSRGRAHDRGGSRRSSAATAPTIVERTTSSGSATPASSRSRVATTPAATATSSGRSGSTPASAPPSGRTSATGCCSRRVAPGSRWPPICPTQIGYDSDDPEVEEEVGRVGVALDSLADAEILFRDIPLDQISTSWTVNGTAAIMLAFYVAVGGKQGVRACAAARHGAERHPQGVRRRAAPGSGRPRRRSG